MLLLGFCLVLKESKDVEKATGKLEMAGLHYDLFRMEATGRTRSGILQLADAVKSPESRAQ